MNAENENVGGRSAEPMDFVDDDENKLWKFKRIVSHQGPLSANDPNYQGSSYNVMIEWENDEVTPLPLSILAADCPLACGSYAKEHGLLETPGWKRFKHIAKSVGGKVNQVGDDNGSSPANVIAKRDDKHIGVGDDVFVGNDSSPAKVIAKHDGGKLNGVGDDMFVGNDSSLIAKRDDKGIEVGDEVFLGNGSAPAKVVQFLAGGNVKLEWIDSTRTNWRNAYHIDELNKLGPRNKRIKRLIDQEEDKTPRKKGKRQAETESIPLQEFKSVHFHGEDSVAAATAAHVPEPAKVSSSIAPKTKSKPATKKKPAVPDLWEVTGVDKDQGLKEVAKLLPRGLKNSKQQVVHFFLFCYERQCVWERRNAGESQPYTESVAMQEYFFCNNYRELDRGTNYFRAHVLNLWEKYNKDGPVDHQTWIRVVLWASVCYRLVNRISTFEDYGCIPEVSDASRFLSWMKKSAEEGKLLFTDAHITSGLNPFLRNVKDLLKKEENKLNQVSRLVFEGCQGGDLKECCEAIKTINGVGNFLAWQIVCDLMESQCLGPCTENDWTELGPGATGGINLVFGPYNRHSFSYLELATTLQEIQDDVFNALGLAFPKWNGVPLTLKNIEHPLCEFQKYNEIHGKQQRKLRVKGQRRKKSRTEQLDFDKSCHFVQSCGSSEDILFCDKCLIGFCEGCVPGDFESSKYWVCPRCTAFEAVSFSE